MIKKHAAGMWRLLFCLSAGLPLHVRAQTTGNSLPLQQAIALTLEHYPSLKAKKTLSKAGEAHTIDVRHNWWPAVRLVEETTIGTDNGLYGSYFPLGTIPSTSGGIRAANKSDLMSGNIAMAQVQWEVYNFGAYRTQREEAIQQQKVAGMDADITANDLMSAVVRDYLGMLQYRALMKIQEDNIERTRSVQRAVTAIVLHGLKPGVDSSIAAAELSKARLNYLDIQNSYRSVRLHMSMLTGLDTSAIQPDTLYNSGLLALLAATTDTSTVAASHPVLQYHNGILLQQQKHEAVIRRAALPKVSILAAGWMRGSSGQFDDIYNKNLWTGLNYSRYNYLAGLALTYNLADIGHTRDRVREQRLKTKAAAEQVQTTQAVLNNSLQQAKLNIHTALDKLQEMPAQLNAARAAALQKMALYKGGLTNIIEVTNALYLLNRAETDMVQTRNAAWQALFTQAFAANAINELVQQLEQARMQ
ncbi:TolC family protein [Chitinophaga rhizophila]|uniref:TolC family protein n=1 Tax=Chitinophaga rhizophila TaxID=2866212 RepID=A0ABS7GHG9_9BACT|nr:TolC family protein [Chitinophaga rhizophila]MBW8686871.1 TolC family protein [Chitinophaga rhizophila]